MLILAPAAAGKALAIGAANVATYKVA